MSHNAYTVNSSAASASGQVTATINPEIRIGSTATDNYSNSSASALDNATLEFYDTNPINTITGATLTGSSNWYSSVTLPAGSYLLEASFSVKFTASGQFAYQFYDGSSSIGARAQVGDVLQFSTEYCHSFASACVTISSNTTFSVKSSSGSTNLDSIANQSTLNSEESWIRITKL